MNDRITLYPLIIAKNSKHWFNPWHGFSSFVDGLGVESWVVRNECLIQAVMLELYIGRCVGMDVELLAVKLLEFVFYAFV